MSSEKSQPGAQPVEAPVPAPAPDISLQLETFVEVYKKQIGIVILVGAVVATFGYAYTVNRDKKEVEAATALAMVQLNLQQTAPGAKAPEPKPDDYFSVANQFEGTSAAEQATLRGAVALFEADKFSEAQAKFEEFLAKYPDSAAKAAAEVGVAASLDAAKQTDRAVEAYQRVINSYATHAAASQAKLALGALHEQKGQPAQALKLYEELSVISPDEGPNVWSLEATTRKERVLAAHPELASAVKAPAPAPVMTPPVVTPAVK